MKIVIVGYGWVGQANALALRIAGEEVYFYDVNPNPTLHYKDKYAAEYEKIGALKSLLEHDGKETYYFVCVGDKVSEEGVQDLTLIKSALESLGTAQGIVVLRSTILPESLKSLQFDIYLPEFLHEKKAVEECITPYLFVRGDRTPGLSVQFLDKWEGVAKKVFKGTPEEASMIKYLSNIWNAVRIAFVNEYGDALPSEAAEKVLSFFFEGQQYMRYGKGFSGHCLPKDIRAFIGSSKQAEKNVPLISGAYESNNFHLKREGQALPEWFSEWQ